MGAHPMNTYGLEYDKLGRLRNTLHYSAAATTQTNSFTERGITYDRNGNIQTLERYGANGQQPESDYQYDYIGNQLTSIGKGQGEGCTTLLYSYEYDSNGNMTKDGLKNLQITYNILNLPEYISKSGTTVNYSWFADGSKYMVTSAGKGYRYTGSLIYTIDLGKLEIESTDFAGGRINFAEAGAGGSLTQEINYFHTDHLGSVRAITDQSGTVVEQNAYYPFGSRHTFGNSYAQTTNRYKYNGKEEQTSGNLQYLDYGARMYDANIGRWFVQDPLSEKYYAHSPYNYCVNNPVMFVDPDGRDWFYYKSDADENPTWHWQEGSTYHTGVINNDGKEVILHGYASVVVFNGSLNEKLGEGDNLFGSGAVLADVTVYGPNGADDIGHYKGFTMSSDSEKYGVVANGFYSVNRISNKESYGPYNTPFAVNNKGKIPALGNYNPAYPNRKPAYLDGVYIHRSNNNGWAGWKCVGEKEVAVSKGCLLVTPSRYNQDGTIKTIGWDQFCIQLKNVNYFLLQIRR